jgi:hypothetical protein
LLTARTLSTKAGDKIEFRSAQRGARTAIAVAHNDGWLLIYQIAKERVRGRAVGR